MINIFLKVKYNYAAKQWLKLLPYDVLLFETNYEWWEWKHYKRVNK